MPPLGVPSVTGCFTVAGRVGSAALVVLSMASLAKSRGPNPRDPEQFAPEDHSRLRSAVGELSWLLSRDYAEASALKLVGDRHNLTARQRSAVRCSACADQARTARQDKHIQLRQQRAARVGIDGFNLLITLESALSGAVVLIGRDGCYRDLAGVRGSYRKVKQTPMAIELVARQLAAYSLDRIDWFLDRPVSNSGRLRTFMTERLSYHLGGGAAVHHIELVDDPDRVLTAYDGTVVSSDSWILDNCSWWTNLAAQIITTAVSAPRLVDLGFGENEQTSLEEVAK